MEQPDILLRLISEAPRDILRHLVLPKLDTCFRGVLRAVCRAARDAVVESCLSVRVARPYKFVASLVGPNWDFDEALQRARPLLEYFGLVSSGADISLTRAFVAAKRGPYLAMNHEYEHARLYLRHSANSPYTIADAFGPSPVFEYDGADQKYKMIPRDTRIMDLSPRTICPLSTCLGMSSLEDAVRLAASVPAYIRGEIISLGRWELVDELAGLYTGFFKDTRHEYSLAGRVEHTPENVQFVREYQARLGLNH